MTSHLHLNEIVRLARPQSFEQLHAYVRLVLGFHMPHAPLVPGHDSPLDYLTHAYFEDHQPRDCIVWANRGGGKTQLGAIATLLDLVFKPGIQIRILGGSFEQSSRMYRYLKRMLEQDAFYGLIAGNLTGRYVELTNGSRVEVLSQSERSIRGQRVHKIRCDEVELFEPEVWDAAQMATRSGWCGDQFVHASIEALSTMHRPYGLMQKLVRESFENKRRVFQWNVLDTLQTCEPERDCEPCPLWNECEGRAKHAQGFIEIDDAIQQKHRVGASSWTAEMLCEQPTHSDCVYPEFDERVHVEDFPSLFEGESKGGGGRGIAGIDFGYRSPTVLLFAYVDHNDVITIVDEIYQTEFITDEFIELASARLQQRNCPQPNWLGADPAGHQRSEHTGVSTISLWKKAGWNVRTRSLSIEAGVMAVRRRLKRADGMVGLKIHQRCEHLIKALSMYHYPTNRPESSTPMKDGHDHAADALRYMITNLDRGSWRAEVRNY